MKLHTRSSFHLLKWKWQTVPAVRLGGGSGNEVISSCESSFADDSLIGSQQPAYQTLILLPLCSHLAWHCRSSQSTCHCATVTFLAHSTVSHAPEFLQYTHLVTVSLSVLSSIQYNMVDLKAPPTSSRMRETANSTVESLVRLPRSNLNVIIQNTYRETNNCSSDSWILRGHSNAHNHQLSSGA